MTKKDFIDILRKRLSVLPKEEMEEALRYYEEFFEDAEDEQKAVNELGSPEKIAEQILVENGFSIDDSNSSSQAENTVSPASKKKNDKILTTIILLIITFPVWITVISVAFALILSFFAVGFALTISLVCAAVALVAGGIILLFTSAPFGLLLIGAGLVLMGLSILLVSPVFSLLGKAFSLIVNGIRNLSTRFIAQREV